MSMPRCKEVMSILVNVERSRLRNIALSTEIITWSTIVGSVQSPEGVTCILYSTEDKGTARSRNGKNVSLSNKIPLNIHKSDCKCFICSDCVTSSLMKLSWFMNLSPVKFSWVCVILSEIYPTLGFKLLHSSVPRLCPSRIKSKKHKGVTSEELIQALFRFENYS